MTLVVRLHQFVIQLLLACHLLERGGMTWIRLEAASGLRVMAPSFGLPPRVEGVDKLFDSPIHARSFHCLRSPANEDDTAGGGGGVSCRRAEEEVLVLVERQNVGERMGEVTIAVGGELALRDELAVVLDCAFHVVRRTNNSGVQFILDALCASAPHRTLVTDEVVEYDGLPRTDGSSWEGRRAAEWREEDAMPFNAKRRSDARSIMFARRRALLYFVAQDVLPVSLLHCRVSGTAPHACTPSVSSATQSTDTELPSLVTTAACSCKCLVDVINRTLAEAFDVRGNTNQHQPLWGEESDKLPFVAVFSTSGLLCASSSFFRLTDHRDRLFVAAAVVDQLCRWPTGRGASAHISLIHVHELLLRCREDGLLLNLVFLSIGNAVSCVFGFHSASEGEKWEAATLLKFVNKTLVTLRSAVSFSAVVDGEDDDDNYDDGSRGAACEFAPHVLLCRASIHPTPCFYRLMYEMDKLEEETPRLLLMGKNGLPKSSTSPSSTPQRCCECCLPLGRREKMTATKRQFVWHKDTVDLSLDVAWCVASSHVVRAEANICNGGRDMGHHSLFSIISSGIEGAEEAGRYGVGWFQHCWRNASCAGFLNGAADRGNCAPAADPTKFLPGLSSIGGGPRASVRYKPKEQRGCFFPHTPRIEACIEGNAPVFNSHMMVFPHVLLFDGGGVEGHMLADEADKTRCVSAFYAMGSHKVKGAACDALLQEMLLMEGDMSDREKDVAALLLQRRRPAFCSEIFALCHEVACCVLEDVWRLSNFIDGSG